MYEFICMILAGLFLIVLGIINFHGNIATIHWYQRTKVSEANRIPYGKCMGISTGLIGVTSIITGILQLLSEQEENFYVLLAGVILGLIIMVYAQFKYNHGII